MNRRREAGPRTVGALLMWLLRDYLRLAGGALLVVGPILVVVAAIQLLRLPPRAEDAIGIALCIVTVVTFAVLLFTHEPPIGVEPGPVRRAILWWRRTFFGRPRRR